jgi:hypothetical protein
LQKVAAAALPFLSVRKPMSPFKGQRPLPKFKVGDLIASDWKDEFGKDIIEFGEIVGLCYLYEGDRTYPSNSWVYHIYWTHDNSGGEHSSCYPCMEWDVSTGEGWRYVGRA